MSVVTRQQAAVDCYYFATEFENTYHNVDTRHENVIKQFKRMLNSISNYYKIIYLPHIITNITFCTK